MEFKAKFIKENAEYEIYFYVSETRGELFCHLSENDFIVFKKICSVPVVEIKEEMVRETEEKLSNTPPSLDALDLIRKDETDETPF